MRYSKYDVASYTVNVDDVNRIIAMLPSLKETLVSMVEKHADAIVGEIDTFNELRMADDRLHAQAALLFAVCSPQCKFDVNVRASHRFLDHINDSFDAVDDVYMTLTDSKRDAWFTAGMSSRGIFGSIEFLRNVNDEDMTKSALKALKKARKISGFAEKTMSMALALYDANSAVYTLDVHMLRGLQSLSGGVVAGSMVITDKAYGMLESALVAWHRETFPTLPIFVSQWALWNEFGFDGDHVCHLGIFGE